MRKLPPTSRVLREYVPGKKPGGRRHKTKGDDYERELAAYLTTYLDPPVRLGEPRRRLLSGSGFSGSTWDIEGTQVALLRHGPTNGTFTEQRLELAIEAKRTESLQVHAAMAQAEKHVQNFAAKGGDPTVTLPMVIARRSRQTTGQSLVVMRLDSLITLLQGHLPARLSALARRKPLVQGVDEPEEEEGAGSR